MSTIFMSTPFDFGSKFHHEDDHDRSGVQDSAVSFLGFDVKELDEEFAILRGLQGFSEAVTLSEGVAGTGPPASLSDDHVKPQGIRKRRRRKRVRRSCTIEGCTNRVVQGGVCIAHGARRKLCKSPGCDKSVKKAGFCSTHGPARKRCEIPGCSRVAVQGGICIGHGAKKNQCEAEGCRRLAVMGGLCKGHCEEVGQAAVSVAPSSPAPAAAPPSEDLFAFDQCFEIPNLAVATAIAQAPAPSRAFQQTMFARQLSIFEEMGIPVESGRVVGNPLPPPPSLPQQMAPGHRSILSRDLQSLFDDDLDFDKFEAI